MSPQQAITAKPRKERKENADKRRQQLLDATLRSIVNNGLSKTTLATVASEAGLSQGVAVFYFKSKTGLLTEALKEQYTRYNDNWAKALAKAGTDPLDQLIALIEADFAPSICNTEALSVWFAFWGEQKFTPQYAEVSVEFDQYRAEAIRDVCHLLLNNSSNVDADRIASWIDTLTDGYWQKLHLFPNSIRRKQAIAETLDFVGKLLPEYADRISRHS
jgi:TetR/AcrR family transcriptional repressor of bet genes